jgi:hypothetical protein
VATSNSLKDIAKDGGKRLDAFDVLLSFDICPAPRCRNANSGSAPPLLNIFGFGIIRYIERNQSVYLKS